MPDRPYEPPRWLTDELDAFATSEVERFNEQAKREVKRRSVWPLLLAGAVMTPALAALFLRLQGRLGRALYDATLASWLHAGERVVKDAQREWKTTLADVPRQPRLVGFLGKLGLPVAKELQQAMQPRGASAVPLPGWYVPPAAEPPKSPPFGILYPPTGDAPLLRFPVIDRAAELLSEAKVMSPADFYRLSVEARGNAFTVSGDMTNKAREQMRALLADNVANITSRQDFVKEIEAKWVGITPARAEQVFRNNVNGAYSDGAEHVLNNRLVSDFMPYRAYYAIHDDRVRHEHKEMESLGLDGSNVYYKDDPTWQRFRPPWSWNCRCGWNPLSTRQAAKKGVGEAKLWLDTNHEPPHVPVTPPPFNPPASWERREVAVA